MKILGIVCSPRKNKTSYKALEKCFENIKEKHSEIELEIIQLSDYKVKPCCACGKCRNGLECSIDDDFKKIIPKLKDENLKGIIISTPVYMGSMTSQCKAFLDRTVMFRRNNFMFKDKVGGVIAVGRSRNGGQEITIQSVHAAFLIHDMIVVSDGHSTSHFGGAVCSGIDSDDTGYETVKNLGLRVSELILKLS